MMCCRLVRLSIPFASQSCNFARALGRRTGNRDELPQPRDLHHTTPLLRTARTHCQHIFLRHSLSTPNRWQLVESALCVVRPTCNITNTHHKQKKLRTHAFIPFAPRPMFTRVPIVHKAHTTHKTSVGERARTHTMGIVLFSVGMSLSLSLSSDCASALVPVRMLKPAGRALRQHVFNGARHKTQCSDVPVSIRGSVFHSKRHTHTRFRFRTYAAAELRISSISISTHSMRLCICVHVCECVFV